MLDAAGFEGAAGFPLFVRALDGASICLQAFPLDSVLTLKFKIHQATGIPSGCQRLIFEGRQLVDGALLQSYGTLTNATISLVSRLRGGAPSFTPPTSYKQAVKIGFAASSGSKDKVPGAKVLSGSAFIVEQSTEPPTAEAEDPHICAYASSYEQRALICRFNGFWPPVSALRDWISKTWAPDLELFLCSKGFFIVNFTKEEDRQ